MEKSIEEVGELTVDLATTIISCHTGNASPLVAPVVSFLLKKGLDKVIKDVVSRQLSDMQKAKVNEVREYAILTFYKLAEENGWDDNGSEGEAYTQTIAESIEDVFNKAVNESRKAKRIMLGALLGSTMYYSNSPHPDMENFFYISNVMDRLTFRQLCLIYMSNGAKEYPLPLAYLIPTQTALDLKSAFVFPNEIKDDFKRVVDSLCLKPINPSEFPDGFLNGLHDAIKRNNQL